MVTNIRQVSQIGENCQYLEYLFNGNYKALNVDAEEKVMKIFNILKDVEFVSSIRVYDETGALEIRF